MVSAAVCARTSLIWTNKHRFPFTFDNVQHDGYEATLAAAEAVLNLRQPYTLSDAKMRRRTLCLKFHPDKGLYKTGKLVQRVNDAFEVVQEHLSMLTIFAVEGTAAALELLTQGAWQSQLTGKLYKFVDAAGSVLLECRGWWREPVDLCYNHVIHQSEARVCGPFRGILFQREIKSTDSKVGLGVLRFSNSECWIQLHVPPPDAVEWWLKDLELGKQDTDIEETTQRLLQEGLWQDSDAFEWVFRRQRFRTRHFDMRSKDLQDLVGEVEITQGQLSFQFHDGSGSKAAVMRLDNDDRPVIVFMEYESGVLLSMPSKSMLGLRGLRKRKRGTRAGKFMRAKHAKC